MNFRADRRDQIGAMRLTRRALAFPYIDAEAVQRASHGRPIEDAQTQLGAGMRTAVVDSGHAVADTEHCDFEMRTDLDDLRAIIGHVGFVQHDLSQLRLP